jgi:hypothetical protein
VPPRMSFVMSVSYPADRLPKPSRIFVRRGSLVKAPHRDEAVKCRLG